MNMLIYDITKTRFSTEEGKKELIDHICNMFSFDKDQDEDIEKSKEKYSNTFMTILSACIGAFSIICTLLIYFKEPQTVSDGNGVASVLFVLLLMLSGISFCFAFLQMPIIFDFYNKGLFEISGVLETSMFESINEIWGKIRNKKAIKKKVTMMKMHKIELERPFKGIGESRALRLEQRKSRCR